MLGCGVVLNERARTLPPYVREGLVPTHPMSQQIVGSRRPPVHLESRSLLPRGPVVAERLGTDNKPILGLQRALPSYPWKMSIPVACRGTKDITLERDEHLFYLNINTFLSGNTY